jgi:hypothetical protein
MNREMVIERLEMLVALIEKSDIVALKNKLGEPGDYKEDAERLGKIDLFNEHLIKMEENIEFIRDLITKNKTTSEDSERMFMISTMRYANRLWKLHHKVITGEFDSIAVLELEEIISEFVDKGQKINAIKYYREWMKDNTGNSVTLRDAKDKIDAYAARAEASLL